MRSIGMWIRRTAWVATMGLAIGACSDAPTAAPASTAPRGTRSPSADVICITSCDEDPGGGGGGVVTNPTFLTDFAVTNCDPTVDFGCVPVNDADYYEIRQNLREADGTQVEYNEQRWHGDTGPLDQQVFTQNLCGNTGRYINVEIYHLSTFNILDRETSFNVTAADNGVLLHVGNGVTWAGYIQYRWTC